MKNKELSGKKYFELTEEQRISWLRLIRSQNVGPATFRDLISHYGTADSALEAIPDLAKRGGAAARIKVCSREEAERELTRVKLSKSRLIGMGEPDYPENLRNADSGPPLLCVKGNVGILKQKAVAIVGSRNASISGLKVAERFSMQLGEHGYTVVSGLARGIDTAAHAAAIKSSTAAVFAGGVDVVFPPENEKLAEELLANQGAIVSEMPMGWQPRAKDFPRRNRIITGLSRAVIVVEAARKSGSLITARMANDSGRLVMAVPGSPLDPRCEGTNSLIREGATLVTNIDEILETLNPIDDEADALNSDISEKERDLFEHETTEKADLGIAVRDRIIGALGPSPVSVDDIIQFAQATPGEVQMTLLELSLAGKIERHPGGLVSIIYEFSS
ncbi:MAG: DNA-processing protein DprA [Pseudomonadota bacterium]